MKVTMNAYGAFPENCLSDGGLPAPVSLSSARGNPGFTASKSLLRQMCTKSKKNKKNCEIAQLVIGDLSIFAAFEVEKTFQIQISL